jgi:formylglycine-generating enzyme required for sulfatase activity
MAGAQQVSESSNGLVETIFDKLGSLRNPLLVFPFAEDRVTDSIATPRAQPGLSRALRGGAPTPIVFISSTAEDLKLHRAAARDAVNTAELVPRMMEYFVAEGDKPLLAACLAKVADADVVVAFVAHRYGWIPPDQPRGADKSITWLECEEAVRAGKEILAFVVDEKASWSEELREEYEIIEAVRQDRATPQLLAGVQRRVARLREFKEWLGAGRIRVTFSSPKELRARVSEALHRWLRDHVLPVHAASSGAGDSTKYLGVLRGRTAYIDIRGLVVGSGRAPQFPIEDLYTNAVMLTALAVVHWNQRRLPEQRAELYASVITWLSRAREQRTGRANADVCATRLEELALAMHRHLEGRQVQVSRRWAAEAIAPAFSGVAETERVREAERFLDEEEIDSGIILAASDGLRFWHLTFQEYLAAKAIGGRADDAQAKLLLEPSEKGAPTKRLHAPEWREVVLLLGGVLRKQGPAKIDGLVKAILDDVRPALTDQARCVGLLGAMLRDLVPFGYTIDDPRYATLSSTVAAIFDPAVSLDVPVKLRIDAVDALGQASDPRLDPANPDRWVTIPAGAFWMGAQSVRASERNYDGEAYDTEAPVHEVTLAEFRIARYPVTVADYRRFIEDRGYADERWWKAGGFEDQQAPDGWPQQILFPSRPVVGVSWSKAIAYCAWAGCRLPTEAEWERAARGREARKFPWGDEPIDPERANYDVNVGHPTPVGVYSHGRTPEGIDDLAGNVWEWCFDRYGPYEKGRGRNPTEVSKDDGCVLRGGSWFWDARYARSAVRYWFHRFDRDVNIGFRVVVGGSVRTRSDG